MLSGAGRPSGGMADAGDLKSPVRKGRVGSTPTSANTSQKGIFQDSWCIFVKFYKFLLTNKNCSYIVTNREI